MNNNRVAELDLFRFVAAISVVLFHYVARYTVDYPLQSGFLSFISSATQYGFLGVPLFFIISGYVILASALNRNARQFAIARFIRLYPVYWVCLILTFFMASNNASYTDLLINLTLLQSFVGVENIDGVYWTLAKELQFYFLILLLIAFNLLKYIKIWLSIWLLFSYTFLIFNIPSFMGMLISPEYSSFFIAGICFYKIKQNKSLAYYNCILFLSLILSCVNTFKFSPSFLATFAEFNSIISSVIVFFIYIIFWLFSSGRVTFTKSNFTILGAITYPLYLLHNAIGKRLIDFLYPSIGIEASILLVTVLMLYVSYLLFAYFESKVSSPLKSFLLKR